VFASDKIKLLRQTQLYIYKPRNLPTRVSAYDQPIIRLYV